MTAALALVITAVWIGVKDLPREREMIRFDTFGAAPDSNGRVPVVSDQHDDTLYMYLDETFKNIIAFEIEK